MDELLATVLSRADADESLPEAAKLLVLEALDGVDAATAVPAESPPAAPARAYLREITVRGFRGIGASASLRVDPGPGLTVVAGRNGCGKSSFAEALELALTRSSYRWNNKRGAVWSSAWRNLHDGQETSIEVRFAEENVGLTTVGVHWAPGADLAEATAWTQRPGAKRRPGLADLGWDRDLELYRPFLSYDELAALFAEPSKLYDALSPILGLERLDDAAKHLKDRLNDLGMHSAEAARLAKELQPVLASSADPRAAQALAQLRRRSPDLDAVAALATGAAPLDPRLHTLRLLVDLPAIARGDWPAARDAHTAATAAREQAVQNLGEAAGRTAHLLTTALEHHEATGDGLCPVCGVGTLDAAWAERARDAVNSAGLFTTALAEASARLERAEAALARLVPPVPDALRQAAADESMAVPSAAEALREWQAWAELARTPGALVTDGDQRLPALASLIERVRAEAEAGIAAREDAWQPLAVRLGEWLVAARRAGEVADHLARVKAAADWLRRNANELRNDRLQPIADQARQIWSMLRQESNVELGPISLEGSATRRRLSLTASVDGQEAGAFAVMSHGEFNALALALFLPRATSPDSPFGFVVIDDPVQAMDPAKVDGLAQVLAHVAHDRQIVVLTHDDRLPEAVRRLQIPGRILEVTRDIESVVTVNEVSNPAHRYLEDARAIASDPAVGDQVARRVIPELCRLALESTCRDRYYRRQLAAGTSRGEVEARWAAVVRTSSRLALALHDDPRASLDAWLRPQRRKAALSVCTSAIHTGLNGNAHPAIRDVESVVNELAGDHAR